MWNAESKLARPFRIPKSAFRIRSRVFEFTIDATCGAARTGTLVLPHGPVETPVFMPVGTQGTVRALSPGDLKAVGRERADRSEEHTSELQSPCNLVCRLLLEQKSAYR